MAKPVDDYCDACERNVANHECKEGILCDECYLNLYYEKDFNIALKLKQDTSDSSKGFEKGDLLIVVAKPRTSNKSAQNISFESEGIGGSFH